ncbi:hypothetical protein [Archangium primigenium]|uniref:hypothetical protein n=1 Tax=[Archangium] primigenium TaxID=2792470 RepID=UPI00195C6547|nr:hypothetical protein [Archangium primigenium]MBM7116464.1 hypothetical protein [Archangium primigenium]
MKNAEEGCVILYGRGAELGDFGVFAQHLAKSLETTFPRERMLVQSIERKKDFFDFFSKTVKGKFKIKQLHVFSHAYGAALSLGYHDPDIGRHRVAVAAEYDEKKNRIPMEKVLATEVGTIFTDDLLTQLLSVKQTVRNTFASKGTSIKLWGCNAGVANWVYSDSEGTYYWRALNTKNTPKPSIAQGIATFFNVETYGALSGSHVEVKVGGRWITSDVYKLKHGKYPPPSIQTRLHPDKGDYVKFKP